MDLDPSTSQNLAIAIGSGGAGAVLLALVNGIIQWLSGSAGRERSRNTDLLSQRNHAVAELAEARQERDEADDERRHALEYAHTLRWLMKSNGLEPPDLPPQLLHNRQPSS